jgi:hypothetical protein
MVDQNGIPDGETAHLDDKKNPARVFKRDYLSVIVELLRERGPMKASEIAEAIDWQESVSTLGVRISKHWATFEKLQIDDKDAWRLK